MLKNDRWIREMADKGMITPFEPSLVRSIDFALQDCDRHRPLQHTVATPSSRPAKEGSQSVISYGTSSFGYDLRLSPSEFRIFRHRPGQIVNPKRFNPELLELTELQHDDDGSFFILPGNSYALGVAVERLEIPSNITCLFVGKSTYARCFSAETKVKLVDGDYTFLELIERSQGGEKLYGYGVNSDRRIVVQELILPRFIETASLIRVTLDSGDSVECTPDHVFLLRDGRQVQAQDLVADDSLHAIYQYESHGYPTVYDPVHASTLEHRLRAMTEVHRMVVRDVFGETKLHVHHKDGDRSNNHPDNLELLTPSEHAAIHNEEDGRHLKGGMEFKKKFESDPLFREQVSSVLHSPDVKLKTKQAGHGWKVSEENAQNLEEARAERWKDPVQRSRQSEVASRGMAALKRRDDITEEVLTAALLETGSIHGASRKLSVDRSAFRRFRGVIESFKQGTLCSNHKVASVERLDGTHPTYCLTAPLTGNFALAVGVFVNNCGVIANLTPGEAGWRGHLTLEFSNSSSADCRIYANEGIVQALFFEGEECETSYEQRSGKYQDQPQQIVFAKQ